MAGKGQIPIADRATSRRFAVRLALFYGASFTLIGTYMPFFPVWLRSVGVDAWWIGLITAVPSVTRFTVLPLVTGLAERRKSLHGAIVVTAFLTALGFAATGLLRLPLAIFLAFAATASVWTAMLPMTDAYALKGVVRHGIDYGPVRLWGSAAFVAGALTCGLLADRISGEHLIWVLVAMAALGAVMGLGLMPLEIPKRAQAAETRARELLRDPGFVAVIVAAGLIQSSHAAYYSFASVSWQAAGLDGLTISALWAVGVVAEIAAFALSPRFTLQPVTLMVVGGLVAALRWTITAQEPAVPILAIVQLAHGCSYGLTQIGTMGLLMRLVPIHLMANGQGFFIACMGLGTCAGSILCGAVYDRMGQGIYYIMALLALLGAAVIWLARQRVAERGQ